MSNKVAHAERAHAILAPSAAKMQMTCLASLVRPRKPLPEKESEYASEGTLAHEWFERVYYGGKELLEKIEDLEMRQHVEDFVDLINATADKIGRDKIVELCIEERVHFSDNIYGTVDVGILYIKEGEKKAYVLDLKYGAGIPVPAEKNVQLSVYFLALCETHNWDATAGTIAIYQPRNFQEDKPLDQWEVKLDYIKSFRRKLKAFEKKALRVLSNEYKAKIKEVPGDHCRWCKRLHECRGYADWASADGLVELSKARPLVPKQEDPVELVKALTDDQIERVLDAEPKIRKFLDAVVKYAIGRCEIEPAFSRKLVPGRSQRKWLKAEDFVAAGLKKLGVKDPWKKTLRGITDIEGEVGKGMIDELTTQSEPSPKLVPYTDPRTAITQAVDLLQPLNTGEDDGYSSKKEDKNNKKEGNRKGSPARTRKEN